MKNIWLGFPNKTKNEKIDILKNNNIINNETENILKENINLPYEIAEQMAENTLGTFALPFSIAPNFLVNDVNYTIPMVTEEPSVIAACSYAGKLISKCGGFKSTIINRKMIGQVALFNIENMTLSIENILKNKQNILNVANNSHPSIVTRGGGAEDIEIKILKNDDIIENENNDNNHTFLVVYLIADVKEAMGANILNNMLEGIKPLLEELTKGEALMGILSNYATESLVTSTCEIDIKYLSNDKDESIKIAKKIDLASKFSKIDIYRATTHNKGIFNGIDAVVIATGNDWRAIEAGGHAYATKNGKYEGLTTWTFNEKENKIIGELTLPMPIATVGGSIGLNPTVKASFNILNYPDAKTLASIIVSVGLAQNFAAIKALVTTGIQKGHMKLHAKSLALFAGAKDDEIEEVVKELINSKYINLETAKNILSNLKENSK